MSKNQASGVIVIGTTNPGKLREIKSILQDPLHTYLALSKIPALPESLLQIEETGTTFLENALIKAKTIGDTLKIPVIAEDSGLVVNTLNGRPGVYSHRYGKNDADRINKLLRELKNVPLEKRQASYICSAVYYHPGKRIIYQAEGKVDGFITLEIQGNQGFGYDPIFYSHELKKTFAKCSEAEKNQVSHRLRALEQLKTKYLSEDQS